MIAHRGMGMAGSATLITPLLSIISISVSSFLLAKSRDLNLGNLSNTSQCAAAAGARSNGLGAESEQMMLHAVDDEAVTHRYTEAIINAFCALHTEDVYYELETRKI